MNRLTKLEIINETAEFYMADPSRRAFRLNKAESPICEYLSENGVSKCAVGRCFTERAIALHGSYSGGFRDLLDEIIREDGSVPMDLTDEEEIDIINDMLQPQYHGHASGFWQSLQNWHDHTGHWKRGNEGLTAMGKTALETLRTEYAGE